MAEGDAESLRTWLDKVPSLALREFADKIGPNDNRATLIEKIMDSPGSRERVRYSMDAEASVQFERDGRDVR